MVKFLFQVNAARVSGDYRLSKDNWRMGLSSHLSSAIGKCSTIGIAYKEQGRHLKFRSWGCQGCTPRFLGERTKIYLEIAATTVAAIHRALW